MKLLRLIAQRVGPSKGNDGNLIEEGNDVDLVSDRPLNEDNISTEGGEANVESYVDINVDIGPIDVDAGIASNVTEQVDGRDKCYLKKGGKNGEVIIEVTRVIDIGGSDNQVKDLGNNSTERQVGVVVKGNKGDGVDVKGDLH